MTWYQVNRGDGVGTSWPSNPARMTVGQAHEAARVYRHGAYGPDVSYADGDFAIRCTIAINQGCVGLPKCNPNQCGCGAIRNPEPRAWDPWSWDVLDRNPEPVRRNWTPDGWVVVEVRV